ncbi:MAG: hypothetical protein KDC76_01795 [Bacteroidetes bacterium]|nr:hypothetical protein [Bacteroidota bacterium]
MNRLLFSGVLAFLFVSVVHAQADTSIFQRLHLGFIVYGDQLMNEYTSANEPLIGRSSGAMLRLETTKHAFSFSTTYHTNRYASSANVFQTLQEHNDEIVSFRWEWEAFKSWRVFRPYLGLSTQADVGRRMIQQHFFRTDDLDVAIQLTRYTLGPNLGLLLDMNRVMIKAGGTAQLGYYKETFPNDRFSFTEGTAFASPLYQMTLLVRCWQQ